MQSENYPDLAAIQAKHITRQCYNASNTVRIQKTKDSLSAQRDNGMERTETFVSASVERATLRLQVVQRLGEV